MGVCSRRLRYLYLVALWVVPTVLTAVLLVGTFRTRCDAFVDQHHTRRLSEQQRVAMAIRSELKFVENDLLYLAGSQAVSEMIHARPDKAAASFLHFANTRQRYDQVRYLDTSGHERLRVNLNSGTASLVAEQSLADKSGRDYFIESHELARGQVYVSAFDLNVENGAIEIPRKPVLRFVTPIFDELGNRRGVLILNYLGAFLLKSIGENVALINEDGFWLHGGDPAEQWGFVFGRTQTFGTSFPKLWAEMSLREQGHLYQDGDLATFFTVHPVGDKGHSWKLVTLDEEPPAIAEMRKDLSIVFAVLLLVYGIAAYALTWRWFDARDQMIAQLNEREAELVEALDNVKQLSGLIPICANCKSIRDDDGFWSQIESYISKHSEAAFTHGICPGCVKELYPDLDLDDD